MLEEFDSYCMKNGLNCAEMLRQLGLHALEQDKEDHQRLKEPEQQPSQQLSIISYPISQNNSNKTNNDIPAENTELIFSYLIQIEKP
jgi:hypothetical protein